MCAGKLSWGAPTTPILPRCVVRRHGKHLIPASFYYSHSFAGARTVSDINSLWREGARNLLKSERELLVDLFRLLCPPPRTMVIPKGVAPIFLEWADLSTRTRNRVKIAELSSCRDGVAVGDLLGIPGFGMRSLLELMCVAEAGIGRLHAILDDLCNTKLANKRKIGRPDSEWRSIEAQVTPRSEPWRNAEALLKELLSFAYDLGLAENLAEVLRPDLLNLAESMSRSVNLRGIPLEKLVDKELRPSVRILTGLRTLLESFSDQEMKTVEYRLCSSPRKTLQATGEALGVTRERVRQIQARVVKRVRQEIAHHLESMSRFLNMTLPPVLTKKEMDEQVSGLFGHDSSLAGILAASCLKGAMDYKDLSGVMLSVEAEQVLNNMQQKAKDESDDVGLVNEKALSSCLPDEDWNSYLPLLIDCLNLKHISGQLCLRDSAKSRVKSALLKIGGPATRDEISAICGLNPTRVGGAISNIPSIVRADLKRWGLREWIDDEYDGITGEILQRIEENGGVVSATYLIQEIPEKFGVSASSVRAYLGTAQFEVFQDEVRAAKSPVFDLLPLKEVVSGFDRDGCPYWNFRVEDRHFDGCSISRVPYEIAKNLGCEAGASIRVPVSAPVGCRDLSVNWSLASSTKASIGYVSDALELLGSKTGELASLVMRNDGSVEFRMAPKPSLSDSDASFLERIKGRRQDL